MLTRSALRERAPCIAALLFTVGSLTLGAGEPTRAVSAGESGRAAASVRTPASPAVSDSRAHARRELEWMRVKLVILRTRLELVNLRKQTSSKQAASAFNDGDDARRALELARRKLVHALSEQRALLKADDEYFRTQSTLTGNRRSWCQWRTERLMEFLQDSGRWSRQASVPCQQPLPLGVIEGAFSVPFTYTCPSGAAIDITVNQDRKGRYRASSVRCRLHSN